MPAAILASVLAVAGATTSTRARRAASMCWNQPPSARQALSSSRTGEPEMAAKVSGMTKRLAASVVTTTGANPSLTSRRTSSTALYTAMPPVTPTSTVRSPSFTPSPLAARRRSRTPPWSPRLARRQSLCDRPILPSATSSSEIVSRFLLRDVTSGGGNSSSSSPSPRLL